MAQAQRKTRPDSSIRPHPTKHDLDGTFDVMCKIGEVTFGHKGSGVETANEAAFRLICQHDTEGEFSFPNPDGSMCVVTVEYRRPQESVEPDDEV